MLVCHLQLLGQDRLRETLKEALVVVQLRRIVPARRRVSSDVIVVIDLAKPMHVRHLFKL